MFLRHLLRYIPSTPFFHHPWAPNTLRFCHQTRVLHTCKKFEFGLNWIWIYHQVSIFSLTIKLSSEPWPEIFKMVLNICVICTMPYYTLEKHTILMHKFVIASNCCGTRKYINTAFWRTNFVCECSIRNYKLVIHAAAPIPSNWLTNTLPSNSLTTTTILHRL